jgi:hypothetical protein
VRRPLHRLRRSPSPASRRRNLTNPLSVSCRCRFSPPRRLSP